ncbi:unnamed protein product [Didymodactylos carnosus]|uniref:Protein kinase domain-containing protein n=1 Tax=Didymodactylos carnosus TaxID=1234261 RepID=A0A8S2DEF8_9BILA|nr:unnamed protein product [Didymodactylos carnosus]CAF3681174.1 unnamed protein product [Didymodactylos carnosus]
MQSTFADKTSKYAILEILGEGAFGCVHKARHRETNEYVAMKKVHMKKTREGIPTAILREAAFLTKMNKSAHQNLIKLKEIIIDSSQDDNQIVVFIFEYIEYDLDRYLKSHRPLNINIIRSLTEQLLTGVSVLHNNSIFHRDIKPQNILITSNGILKIADFGLAREYNYTKLLTSVVVTMWYRAPEVLLQASYNMAVDIWSVGCIFAEMAFGKALFPGKTEIDQLKKIICLFGLPDKSDWPDKAKITRESFTNCNKTSTTLERLIRFTDKCASDLLQSLLEFNAKNRCSAKKALQHDFFRKSDHTMCTVSFDDQSLSTAVDDIFDYKQTYLDTISPCDTNSDYEIQSVRSEFTDSFDVFHSPPMLLYDDSSPIDVFAWYCPTSP